MAAEGIDIRRGRAVRDADGYWVARFELQTSHPSVDLAQLDWVALTQMPRELEGLAIRLSRYSFTEVPEHGGCIHLELVELSDSVGLLAAVFSWLESLDLVPVEFELETHGDQVRDGFWLKAVEERRPRDEVCLALGRRLADFIAA
jgi:hypothetical protein